MNQGVKTKRLEARRKLLKSAAAGGAIATVLPNSWVKPVVDMALLPAHAQTSVLTCNVDCPDGIDIVLDWSIGTPVDLDLEVLTPGGTRIAPKLANGARVGQCGLEHQGDSPSSNVGNEEVTTNGSAMLTAGRYQIFVRNNPGNTATSFFVSVTACGNSTGAGGGGLPGDNIFQFGSINLSSGGTATVRVGNL